MPKVKGKNLPPVRVDEAFYNLTVKCAKEADEYLSDYIRKAVEMRNKQMEQFKFPDDIPEVKREIKPLPITSFKGVTETPLEVISTVKPEIQKLKDMVKEKEKPKTIERTFFK